MPDVLTPSAGTRPHGARHARVRCRLLASRLDVPVWVLLIEVFIGLGWLRAAAEKIIDPAWWSGDVVADFLVAHEGATLPWYRLVEEAIVRPGMGLVLIYVVLAQLAIGAALVAGVRRELALGVGVFLNLNFIALGAVTPSAFYVLAQLAVLLWVVESRLDHGAMRSVAAAGAVTGLVLAVTSLPAVSTIDPALVIDDPAVMLTLLGVLVTAACLVLLHRPDAQRSNATYEYS